MLEQSSFPFCHPPTTSGDKFTGNGESYLKNIMNISENNKLVPRIAEQLIIELFAGQTKELNEIKTKVEEGHKQRGGLPHTAKIHPVERALDNLKRDGKAEKPPHVYWKIHATKEQTTTENTIKTLDEFIAWANQFDEEEYVFRGVPNKVYKIQASAYRRSEENDRNFVNFLHTNKDLIRTARQRGYDHKDGREWNELEILVQLQHFRAATCLIDFSYSAQVALWFACQQEQKKEKPVVRKIVITFRTVKSLLSRLNSQNIPRLRLIL